MPDRLIACHDGWWVGLPLMSWVVLVYHNVTPNFHLLLLLKYLADVRGQGNCFTLGSLPGTGESCAATSDRQCYS